MLNYAVSLEERESKLSSALSEYCGTDARCDVWTDTSLKIIEWLTKLMGDKGNFITWWMWDANHGQSSYNKITLDNIAVPIETADDLYNFLTGNLEKWKS